MSRAIALFGLTLSLLFAGALVSGTVAAADGNRLAYLDGPLDPYYPHREFPKLITPQWVGEEGVEAVVTLAIDDMRDTAKYEAYLRPILDRLKQIDGRAPVSIMTCRVDPQDPQLQKWLKEGLSFEVHTYDHPCPLLQGSDFAKAKETYEKCVDLVSQIPGNKPVAFRMPCCDSKNTPSPRFWAEIFNKTTAQGNFLQLDSSVFNIITSEDKELPAEITKLPDGTERFRRYVPFPSFVNTIEDYPYPYVIGGTCWEFPCVVPSDWSAQHVQKPNNPDTVRDWKLALDAIVLKKGVFNLVFHPHGWIRNDQIVELIDHAVQKHGKKVKFLTFKECAERLNRSLLIDQPLRNPDGSFSGSILIDSRDAPDGFIDIEFGEEGPIDLRIWKPERQFWDTYVKAPNYPWGEFFRFKYESPLQYSETSYSRTCDLDGDGEAEKIGVFSWPYPTEEERKKYLKETGRHLQQISEVRLHNGEDAGFNLPGDLQMGKIRHHDEIRFIDVNADGKLDCLFSNAERYSLHLFKDMKEGWSIKVIEGVRGKEGGIGPVIPPFVRADGTNNGAWFHSGSIWWQNEDTARLPDNVDRLSFADLLKPLAEKANGGRSEKASGGRQPPDDAAPPRNPAPTNKPKSPAPKAEECCTGLEPEKPQKETPNTRPPRETTAPYQQRARELFRFVSDQLQPPTGKIEMMPPKSPEEALASMVLPPGMKIELVATEPLVVDPVAFDWGPDGRLWVIEMRDYPNGITWKKKGDPVGQPGGRVKVLTDTNGDGRYDEAKVFLDEIPFPTGIKVWRKGILVSAAPEIFYAEDANGDDRADVRKTLYRGFGEGNQQHRVNGLRWGLDGWLYVGNGDSGGVIASVGRVSDADAELEKGKRHGVASNTAAITQVNVSGRDLRIRPDTGGIETQSGSTQFGRERDDWGNWFGGNNSNPMWHYVLDEHYLRRNPHVAPPPVRKDVPVVPGAAPVFPKSTTLTRFNDANKANRFTSACSPIIYRDELLGPEFYGNSFVCEPVHNLVHREILTPSGTTFTSRRADDEQQSEFLASTDSWFRPSMCRTGPDGALWVSDMYRFVIEHPKWIPAEMQAQLELRAGDDKGRIYRIYPANAEPRPIVRLDKLDTAGLVAALDSPNGPQRDLAQQMLLWKADQTPAAALEKLARESTRPATRVQALHTLAGFDAIAPQFLLNALADPHPGVRRQAVRLAEPLLAGAPQVGEAVLKLATDADPGVRLQVAYSLGAWDDPRAAKTLARLLLNSQNDPYLTAAALSSVNKQNVAAVLQPILATSAAEPPAALIEQLLAVAAAVGSDAAAREVLAAALPQAGKDVQLWQMVAVARFLEEVDRRKLDIQQFFGGEARKGLDEFLATARQIARGEGSGRQQELVFREAAIRMLGRSQEGSQEDVALLGELLAPQQSAAVQASALKALLKLPKADVPRLVLAGWNSHTPPLRQQILDALLSRADWSSALLTAIEEKQVSASQLDARRRGQLLAAKDAALRQRAEKLLAGAVDANRQKVIEQYSSALTAMGDAAAGKAIFAKRCANCHRLEGVGHFVGPDLAALSNRNSDALLTAILDPNRAVEDKFLDYAAVTVDGRILSGMLLAETGASLTLAGPEGKQQTILRNEIEQLKSTGKSLMPEGVEKDVTPAEMAHLLAYLRVSGPAPKTLPGNRPEVVRPFVDGSIRLLATNARIYGPKVILEEKFRNLGYWQSPEDHAAWSFEAGAAGDYRVLLDFACDDAAAGNSFAIAAAGQTLRGKVTSTGSWDVYHGKDAGTIRLAEGPGELLIRSDGPIRGALLDLRGIRLVPVKK